MDKKLLKLIKEQEKQNFPQKIREKLSKKKGFFLINAVCIIIALIIEFIISWIFKTDFNLDSLQILDKSDFEKSNEEALRPSSIIRTAIIITVCIIILIFAH